MNVYDDLSINKKENNGKKCVWMDQIGLCSWYILEKKFFNENFLSYYREFSVKRDGTY